jgi:uncharacterized protein YjbJ (UPF0337 family)
MGITDKIKGRAKQAIGDLTGDADTRRQGTLDERKADAQDDAARAEEQAERKRAEAEQLDRRP